MGSSARLPAFAFVPDQAELCRVQGAGQFGKRDDQSHALALRSTLGQAIAPLIAVDKAEALSEPILWTIMNAKGGIQSSKRTTGKSQKGRESNKQGKQKVFALSPALAALFTVTYLQPPNNSQQRLEYQYNPSGVFQATSRSPNFSSTVLTFDSFLTWAVPAVC